MKILLAIAKTSAYCCGWVGLFLLCRVAAWSFGLPSWWSLPAALVIGLLALFSGKFLTLTKQAAKTRDAEAPDSPRMSVRFRRAWERGRSYRKVRSFPPAPELPWYVSLSMPGSLSGHLLELGDAAVEDTVDFGDAFVWRKGPKAAWLDFPETSLDDANWRSFTDMLGGIPQFTPPAGVLLRIDCTRLINNTHTTVHDDTPVIRRRLELLQKACRKRLPVYLVVDNVDRLYGLRSIMSRVNTAGLAMPLGRIRRDAGDDSAAFVSACIADCLAALPAALPDSAPAVLQAPDEIRRLETPLIAMLAQLGKNNDKAPFVRGLFFAAAAPGGELTPSLLSRLPTFRPVEETLPVQPWFLRTLLRESIPSDAEPARYAVGEPLRFAYPAGAAGLLAASVVLCLLMTFSFMESRGVLLSARGRAASPASAEKLQPYLELTTLTRLRNNGWRLPRFGMNEPEELEEVLRRRFTDSYFDLKTIPSIEHVQDAAIEAAESDDPVAIGNALLLLAVTRDGIGRNIDRSKNGARNTRFLQTLVKALRLASDEDMRQLETYFAWAGQQDWMPETHAALIDFEKYIIDNAGGGDLSWLPAWIGRLPGLKAVDTARVWDVQPGTSRRESRVSPEWTMDGYRIAQSVLAAVKYNDDGSGAWKKKCEQALSEYRMGALEQWRSAAAVLWDDFQARIPDSKVRELFRDAVLGDDPAGRFLQLVHLELLPMFDNVTDSTDPDSHWLRLYAGLMPPSVTVAEQQGLGELAGRVAEAVREMGSDSGMERLSRQIRAEPAGGALAGTIREWRNTLLQAGLAVENPEHNLEAVRAQFLSWGNPGHVSFSGQHAALQEALEPAERIHRYLRETSGSAAWDGLSPLATLDYMRYLATRQAALKLDAMWREQVYQPVQLTPGGDTERLARLTAEGGPLETFLTGVASGFWRWNGERLVNTEWNRLEFMFDSAFLEFCSSTLRDETGTDVNTVEIPFSVDAVHVDNGARERPVAVHFVFASGGEKQEITFKNYRLREVLTWRMGDGGTAEIHIVFPSVTVSARFAGAELEQLFHRLEEGAVEFSREQFPSVRDALERMGIGRMILRARMESGDVFPKRSSVKAFGLPESVISRCLAPETKNTTVAAYGPFASKQVFLK